MKDSNLASVGPSWWEPCLSSVTGDLSRIQFEEVHKWSAERGETVQAITGIPFYYRQFGYEMALDLDATSIRW